MIGSDTPAFARRGARVHAEWQTLLQCCRYERDKLLEMPRVRLAQLFAICGARERVRQFVGAPLEERLSALHDQWEPRLRVTPPPARRESDLMRAVALCGDSFARFNRRWRRFIDEVDLAPLNRLRRAYNAWYVIEKECAVGSARTARDGYQPLPPATAEDLLQAFPLLPEVAVSRR